MATVDSREEWKVETQVNRRNFIGGLLALGASFTVLPPATTYDRIWKTQYIGGHEDTFIFSSRAYCGAWNFVSEHDIIHLDLEHDPLYRAIFSPPTAMCPTSPPPLC